MEKTIFLFCLLFVNELNSTKSGSRRDVRVTILPPCKDNDRHPFRYSGNTIKRDAFIFSLNGIFTADRNLRSGSEV